MVDMKRGYNLYDPIYQKWLEVNGLVSNSVVALLSNIPALTPVGVTNVEQLASNEQSLENNQLMW